MAPSIEDEPALVDPRLEENGEDVWLVLPKLLSVPDTDASDVISLASEVAGKIARTTSLVRLCHRTVGCTKNIWKGRKSSMVMSERKQDGHAASGMAPVKILFGKPEVASIASYNRFVCTWTRLSAR